MQHTIEKHRSVDVHHVITAASEVMKVSKADLRGDRRARPITEARHTAITVARMLTGRSLMALSRDFNVADHTVIRYAINITEERVATRPDIALAMVEIEAKARALAGAPPAPVAVSVERVRAEVEAVAEVAKAAEAAENPLNEDQRREFVRLVHKGWTPKGLAKRYDLPLDFTRIEYEAARAAA